VAGGIGFLVIGIMVLFAADMKNGFGKEVENHQD
jgi:hypothetical protein